MNSDQNLDMANNIDITFPDNLVIPKYLVTEINALDHIGISFNNEWPLSVIFDKKSMSEYNQIFSFLLKIQRVIYILSKKDLWSLSHKELYHRRRNRQEEDEDEADLRNLAEENSKIYNAYQHKFLLFQRELLHFAKNFEIFIKTRVLLHCTAEFEKNFSNAENMDTLIRFHTGFLNKVLNLCLLQQSSQKLRETILNVLNNAIQLRECFKKFVELDLHSESMKLEVHNIMKEFARLQENHQICMRFITAFMEKKTKSNLTSHLDDAYCRLNFNYFYSVIKGHP